nr:putative uncharacterized oxidoreductase [Quercus suber]
MYLFRWSPPSLPESRTAAKSRPEGEIEHIRDRDLNCHKSKNASRTDSDHGRDRPPGLSHARHPATACHYRRRRYPAHRLSRAHGFRPGRGVSAPSVISHRSLTHARQTDWQKLLYEPAGKGTTNILTAALRESRVRRVVITSSVVVLEPKDGSNRAGPYDLRDLPDQASMNNASTAEEAYILSKVLSHVTATKFAEAHRSFDLVRVLPGYIQGANELRNSVADLSDSKRNGSNEGIMNTALGNVMNCTRTTAQVLLDDVAKAHVLALRPEIAKHGDCLSVVGNGGDSMPWSQYVPIIQKLFPEAVKKGIVNPSAEDEVYLTYFDVSAAEKALGFKFSGAEEMVQSVVGQYIELVESA